MSKTEVTKSTRSLEHARDVKVTGDYSVFVCPETGEHFTVDNMTLCVLVSRMTRAA